MIEKPSVKPTKARVLSTKGDSSSIKFVLFEAGDSLQGILEGGVERIGLAEARFVVKGLNKADNFIRSMTSANNTAAVGLLKDWIGERFQHGELSTVGHSAGFHWLIS